MASLDERMQALQESLGMPEEDREVIAAAMADVTESGMAPGLAVGATAPDLTLPATDGRAVRLSEAASDGALVVSFYRGGWCPYCSLELQALGERLDDFAAAGAGVVSISPEKAEHTVALAEREQLGFPVLIDAHQEAGRAFEVVFTAPAAVKDLYVGKWGFDLSRQTADGSWDLPIPATFVLDADLVVRAAWVDSNYMRRTDPDDILAAVQELVTGPTT
jgi:peroxiredoxin